MNKNRRPILIGDLKLDIERQSVSRHGIAIELPGLSFRLLEELAACWPCTASRRDLAKALWGDIVVTDDALRQRVRLLRRSLGENNYVAAVKGVGYRLVAPVSLLAQRKRRRIFYAATALTLIGLLAFFALSDSGDHELTHAINHSLRH